MSTLSVDLDDLRMLCHWATLQAVTFANSAS